MSKRSVRKSRHFVQQQSFAERVKAGQIKREAASLPKGSKTELVEAIASGNSSLTNLDHGDREEHDQYAAVEAALMRPLTDEEKKSLNRDGCLEMEHVHDAHCNHGDES